MRQQTTISILLIIFAVTILSGCTTSTTPLDPENAGIWDRYFVIPLSDLLDLFQQFTGNYGWAILIVTFFVRLLIFPISWKQQKNMFKMKELKPQMDKIREKYKNDPQKAQEETLKLFQANDYNPAAGCLPILIQIPIIIALFQAIMRNSHIAETSFLYFKMGAPDPYYILPILAAATTYIQTAITGASAPDSAPQMNLLLVIFPVMIFFLSLNFPSALVLYWIYGNIFTILQYALFLKPYNEKLTREGTAR